jgi:hypothetical protein
VGVVRGLKFCVGLYGQLNSVMFPFGVLTKASDPPQPWTGGFGHPKFELM